MWTKLALFVASDRAGITFCPHRVQKFLHSSAVVDAVFTLC